MFIETTASKIPTVNVQVIVGMGGGEYSIERLTQMFILPRPGECHNDKINFHLIYGKRTV